MLNDNAQAERNTCVYTNDGNARHAAEGHGGPYVDSIGERRPPDARLTLRGA